jgi:hypothetical protein
MPLRSLAESVDTLQQLIEQSRRLRSRDDTPEDAIQKVDRITDETLDNMKTLIAVLTDAHARGDLEAMVRKEKDLLDD